MGGEGHELIQRIKSTRQHPVRNGQESVCHVDGSLKRTDLPIPIYIIIKLALHALEIRPDRPHKYKEGRSKEYDRKHIPVGKSCVRIRKAVTELTGSDIP